MWQKIDSCASTGLFEKKHQTYYEQSTYLCFPPIVSKQEWKLRELCVHPLQIKQELSAPCHSPGVMSELMPSWLLVYDQTISFCSLRVHSSSTVFT